MWLSQKGNGNAVNDIENQTLSFFLVTLDF